MLTDLVLQLQLFLFTAACLKEMFHDIIVRCSTPSPALVGKLVSSRPCSRFFIKS